MSGAALVSFVLLFATATVATVAAVLVWARVRVPGARAMALLLGAVAANCVLYACEFAATAVSAKLAFEQALLVGWEVVPILWFVFALQFTGRGRCVRPWLVAALCVVPAVGLALALTNARHHLFLTAYSVPAGDAHLALRRELGPAFLAHATYAYALLAVGTVLLLGLYWRSRKLYRRQALALLVAVLLPWVADVVVLSGSYPLAGADVQAVVFAVAALLMVYALVRLRVSDVLAVSRAAILDSLPDAVMVLDAAGGVLYANPAGSGLLEQVAPVPDPARRQRVWPGAAPDPPPDGDGPAPASGDGFRVGGLTYDLRLSPVHDASGGTVARLLLARDVTDRVRAERDLEESHARNLRAMDDTVQALSAVVESRDPYTRGHQRRVRALAKLIAEEMGLPDDEVRGLCVAAEVHDIGKMSVPVEILARPVRLTEVEFALVQDHAESGYRILQGIDFPWPVADVVRQHHEKLDGSGYPCGLEGDAILLPARILCVADVVEAMASDRPYRPALGVPAAVEEITAQRGRLFDPVVVDACLRVLERGGFELPE